ncbi:MAG: hypothetical protein ACI945_001536 [Pseudohongiellaceae bacterium]|jgi:hypothetical protein
MNTPTLRDRAELDALCDLRDFFLVLTEIFAWFGPVFLIEMRT